MYAVVARSRPAPLWLSEDMIHDRIPTSSNRPYVPALFQR
jgi:hypothetical protein